jgi:hypothetical protein
MTNYQDISNEIAYGTTLLDAVQLLLSYKETGQLACANFNGFMLYSDSITIDGAFLQVHRMTKGEYDKYEEDFLNSGKGTFFHVNQEEK